MIVALPTPEERKAILAANHGRYPEAKVVTLDGDGGKEEKLTVLLGTPGPMCPGWEQAVAATFKPRTVESDSSALVADCLLWPDPATWGGIVRRWPGLPDTLARVVRRKLGSAQSAFDVPGDKEERPTLVKEAQARNAGVIWRRLKPAAEASIDVAIQPPDEMVWRMFQQQMAKDDAPCWKLVRDFAEASIAASSMPVGDLFTRWPGVALLVALSASKLGGVSAEVEEGEF